jgi:hypothetical protein
MISSFVLYDRFNGVGNLNHSIVGVRAVGTGVDVGNEIIDGTSDGSMVSTEMVFDTGAQDTKMKAARKTFAMFCILIDYFPV